MPPPLLLLLSLLLSALMNPSFGDTLNCGAVNFQVTFEPSRPILSISSSGSSSSSSANSGLSQQQSTASKYAFRPLDQLLLPPTFSQVCNLSSTGAQMLLPQPPTQLRISGRLAIGTLDSRLVITKCDSCSNCPQELPLLHRVLTRMAAEGGIQSLLVVVVLANGKDGAGAEGGVRLAENTAVKFVYMDDEPAPGALDFCELSDSLDSDALKSFSKTSVLFVSISFIILMIISLAWLVFYYVQRFRYAHAKDRLQRRLFNAAKKALARIPTRPVKASDKELECDCPVCLDSYSIGDIVRILPCRHIFHKSCVDPWLLEHRSCPMCKSDILKAFGYHVSVSSRRRAQFSSSHLDDEDVPDGNGDDLHDHHNHHRHHSHRSHHHSHHHHNHHHHHHHHHHMDSDRLSMDANSTTSESNAFPFPVVSEVHDPFSPSSPQLVQVVHATNARGFAIIPLTVHSGEGDGEEGVGGVPSEQPPKQPQRKESVGLPSVSAPSLQHHHSNGRLLRALTTGSGTSTRRMATLSGGGGGGGGSAPRGGHIVNLVHHVRSRSLSNAQLPAGFSSILGGGGGIAVPIEYHQEVGAAGDGLEDLMESATGRAGSAAERRPTALFRIKHPAPLNSAGGEGERAPPAPRNISSVGSSSSVSTPIRKDQFVRRHSSKQRPMTSAGAGVVAVEVPIKKLQVLPISAKRSTSHASKVPWKAKEVMKGVGKEGAREAKEGTRPEEEEDERSIESV